MFSVTLCSYISKVDVVKILVAANYQDVPSIEQILQPAAITRLRNKLLETEYYALAVEVNEKFYFKYIFSAIRDAINI